jgi:hypothetical protein
MSKTKKPAKKAPSAATGKPRWSIGLFRNAQGKLRTIYVSAEGVPMPYEQDRLNGKKILFHATYTGMKYSQARQHLLKDSGLKDEPRVEGSANGKAAAKKAKAKKVQKKAA